MTGHGECGVCDTRAATATESLVYTDDQWTAALCHDVPGWLIVMANRHSDDWLWGLSEAEALTLGPLMRRLSAAARSEAGAESVYLMGFGENNRHFHFILIGRTASIPADMRGSSLLEKAPELADREQALRVGARIRAKFETGD